MSARMFLALEVSDTIRDGLVAAQDRLYMSTMDGTLICFGGEK